MIFDSNIIYRYNWINCIHNVQEIYLLHNIYNAKKIFKLIISDMKRIIYTR